ncbi:MAG TPA: glycosyltransferase [Polyangia bacterium]|nr:glycosyltransferase [Polyangia bacterium]
MSARLKVLFVTHTVDPMGGAARSLRELLEAWDVDADLMVPRFNGAPDDATIRAFFGTRVRRIFRRWLAYDMCYRGRPAFLESPRRWALFPLMWRLDRDRFHRFVTRHGYDLVHLNSIVLHPIVRAGGPFVLHVREILDGAQPQALASAARARGVVFIDEATRAPFAATPLRASVVLNNPVDMRAVGQAPADAAARLGGDPAALTIFAIVGTLIPEKGVDVVLEAFAALDAPDARLLVVGKGAPDYTARLRAIAGGDRRVVFWGEEPNIAAVYTLADWVVRGEPYHCVGRTVYEALYSGCGVIVPGEPQRHAFFEFDRFSARICFYRPSDRAELTRAFAAARGQKRTAKRGESNAPAYAAAFDRFAREIAADRAV